VAPDRLASDGAAQGAIRRRGFADMETSGAARGRREWVFDPHFFAKGFAIGDLFL